MPQKKVNNVVGVANLYAPLMAHFLHQDKIMWDFTRLVIPIQGAVLASSYALKQHWLGTAIPIAGACLTIMLAVLVGKAEKDRDSNLELMDMIVEDSLPEQYKEKLKCKNDDSLYIRLAVKPYRRGEHIISMVLFSFALFDFGFSFLIWRGLV